MSIPEGQALTIVDGKHKLVPLSELKEKINNKTRYLPERLEMKIVTCTDEGFQQVFWINNTDFHKKANSVAGFRSTSITRSL